MTPAAHKCTTPGATAGQIVNDIPKELVYRGTTVYAPPTPQEPAEVRLNRLVGALEGVCASEEVVEERSRNLASVRTSTIRRLIAENT